MDKMKVGILTYHFSNNYGALFQAYALRDWFIGQGHQADFVNYHPDHVESGGGLTFSNALTKAGIKILFLKFMAQKEKWFGNDASRAGFQEFKRDFLGVHGPEYKTITQLNAARLNCDLLVCGSDQIWNPSDQYGLDQAYFLDFEISNPRVRKISYAPSFGASCLPARFESEAADLISKLDAVSVREKSAIEIVGRLTGKMAVLVPDPTFLSEDYSALLKEYTVDSEDYVFCYYLRSRHHVGEVAEKVSSVLGAGLYSPHNPLRRWAEVGETVYPCPRQWLYLLHGSKFAVTNTFHGTAMSILLNKPFIAIGIGGAKAKLGERMINLLSQTGLEDRLIDHYDEGLVMSLLSKDIDWGKVNESVASMRKEDVLFLESQLGLAQ